MTISMFIGAYWGPRQESLESCVCRLHMAFQTLAAMSPDLARWHLKAKSRAAALRHTVDVGDVQQLRDMLLRGQRRDDVGHALMISLGFSFGLWNGMTDLHEAAVNGTIGLHSRTTAQSLGNCFLVTLPSTFQQSADAAAAGKGLYSLAVALGAEWAGIMPRRATAEASFDARVPQVHWITFVGRRQVPESRELHIIREARGCLVVSGATCEQSLGPRERTAQELYQVSLHREWRR